MSKMKEIYYEIQDLYEAGFSTHAIAQELQVPIELVLGAVENFCINDLVG
ncbi:hypothetical protein UFOVP1636_270 [uncultured Caudovirales phage]|uniref:Uncharacterized protein n=1 Tax=uncultured Caudovirales phage TaxID=2100421 RepID=A0A6J5T477_9CAUD|nr:hypothetical protein UFOVP1636_270 [uncultured Caudovirales phage]